MISYNNNKNYTLGHYGRDTSNFLVTLPVSPYICVSLSCIPIHRHFPHVISFHIRVECDITFLTLNVIYFSIPLNWPPPPSPSTTTNFSFFVLFLFFSAVSFLFTPKTRNILHSFAQLRQVNEQVN